MQRSWFWLHAAVLALVLPGLGGCGGGSDPAPPTPPPTSTSAPAPVDAEPADVSSAEEAPVAAAGEGPVGVVLETSKGSIELELYPDKAPVTVQNFVDYVKAGHYDGTIFHRVIPGFMIQGGGMTPDMEEKPEGEPIRNEATNGLKNERGTIAMARTSEVDSATAQFFINVADNEQLDHVSTHPLEFGYAVFGKVTSGMDVADKIVAVPTTSQGIHQNVPVDPVIIKSARLK